MPEGPEVLLSSELIKPLAVNKPIIIANYTSNSRYSSSPPEGYKDFIQAVSSSPKPTAVTDIQVRGKFMYWSFDNGWHMFCTFGMSGQWSPKEE
jgi:formamidopyrimidine-DNA glycosylase